MDFKETFPAMRQCKNLLGSLEKLEKLKDADALSFQDGEFLQSEVAHWRMNEYWCALAINFKNSTETVQELVQDFSDALRERYYAASMQKAFFDTEEGLGSKLKEAVVALPSVFKNIEVAAVSAHDWVRVDLAALVQKAQVASSSSVFSGCGWGSGGAFKLSKRLCSIARIKSEL